MLIKGTIHLLEWSGGTPQVFVSPEMMPLAAYVAKHFGRFGSVRVTIAIPGVRMVHAEGELALNCQFLGGSSASAGLEERVWFRVGDLDVLAGLARHVGKSVILEIRAT